MSGKYYNCGCSVGSSLCNLNPQNGCVRGWIIVCIVSSENMKKRCFVLATEAQVHGIVRPIGVENKILGAM